MDPVQEYPLLPQVNAGPHQGMLATLLVTMRDILRSYATRINLVLPADGTEPMTGPLELMTYTTATRPTASSYTGSVIYVSDGAAGSKFQGSDGASWVSLG